MMEEEEFDEFEEATYSHSQPDAQQSSASPDHSTHAVAGLELLQYAHPLDPINPPPAPLPTQQATGGLETHSPVEEEAIWPQLGKTSSSHAPAQEPYLVDFSKSYSLTEQTNTPTTNNYFSFDAADHHKPAAFDFTHPSPSAPPQDLPFSSSPAVSNSLLLQFQPLQGHFDPLGFEPGKVVSQDDEAKVEVFLQVGTTSLATNLQTSQGVSAANDFDLLTPMTEQPPATSQKEVKVELKAANELLANDDLFQFGLYAAQPTTAFEQPSEPQAVFSVDPVIQQPTETKPAVEELNWMESYIVQPSTTSYLGSEQTQPEIVEDGPQAEQAKVEEGERKESQQFEFHEAKAAEPEVDARKQSEEFVFQTTQQPLVIPEDPIQKEAQYYQPQQQAYQPTYSAYQPTYSAYQPTYQQFHPAEDLQPPEEAIQVQKQQQQAIQVQHQQQQQQEKVQQAAEDEDDEDEFGDFEETTIVQDAHPEPTAVNGSAEDNTVHINEEYLNSQESEFYRSRQKELQQFVDSLPDYSFLFASSFLSA